MSQLQNHSSGKITFSWEKKPGVSKEITTQGHENLIQKEFLSNNKLPPPPACSAEAATNTSTPARNLVHDFQIPLPPCPFQPPYYRTSSKKGLWINDPFLAAYKECTKNQKGANKKLTKGRRNSESRLWKSLSFFSCKRSSIVCDDNLVRNHDIDI